MSIGRGVITAVALHQVDSTPHAQTGTQSNHQSLQNVNCTVKEFHRKISFVLKKRPCTHLKSVCKKPKTTAKADFPVYLLGQ